MYALPVLKLQSDGSFNFSQGLLYQLPPELTGPQRFKTFVKVKTLGWNKTEFGYESYCFNAQNGERYIFPAIYLSDGAKPSKKFVGYTSSFCRSQVEVYARGIVERENQFRIKIESELNSFIHDLRKLSTAIYHQALQAEQEIHEGNHKAKNLIQNVIASQTMLKLRTDVLDVSGGIIGDETKKFIQIYKKVDKVVKCFRPIANSKDVSIKLNRGSTATSFGPNVFEIICYILIDNAVKYCRKNEEINVTFADSEKNIVFRIQSYGPTVNEDEYEKIFEKGYKGREAVSSGSSGSGLGLHLARDLLKTFNGKVLFQTIDTEIDLLGHSRSSHYFEVTVPIRY